MSKQTLDCSTSSNLSSAAYYKDSKVLAVTFKSGATYFYDGVPQDVWAAFQAAPSKGSYLASQVKPNYSCRTEAV